MPQTQKLPQKLAQYVIKNATEMKPREDLLVHSTSSSFLSSNILTP